MYENGNAVSTKTTGSALSRADEEKVRLFNLRIKALRSEEHMSSGSGFSSSAYSTDDEGEGRQDFPKEDYLGDFVEPEEATVNKIIAQVEYYFSDAHVHRDSFMQKHIRRGANGFISVKLLACFRKVKTLTKDFRVVAYSLRRSPNLEVNKLGSKVRRIAAFPNDLSERAVQVVLVVGVEVGGSEVVVEAWIRKLFEYLFRKGAGRMDGMMEGRKDGMMEGRKDGMMEGRKDSMMEGRKDGKMDGIKGKEDESVDVRGGSTEKAPDGHGGGSSRDGGSSGGAVRTDTPEMRDSHATISDVRVLTEWKYIPKAYRDSHADIFTFHPSSSVLVDLFQPPSINIATSNRILQDDCSNSEWKEVGWSKKLQLHQLPCLKAAPLLPRRKAKASKEKVSIACEKREKGMSEDGLKEEMGEGWAKGFERTSWRTREDQSALKGQHHKPCMDTSDSLANSPPSFPHKTTKHPHHKTKRNQDRWDDAYSPTHPSTNPPTINTHPATNSLTLNTHLSTNSPSTIIHLSTPSPTTLSSTKAPSTSPWSTPSSSPRNSPTAARRRSKLGPSPLLHDTSGGESPRSGSPWFRRKLLSANTSFSPGTSPLASRRFWGGEAGGEGEVVVKVLRLPKGPNEVTKGFSLVRSHPTNSCFKSDFENYKNNI